MGANFSVPAEGMNAVERAEFEKAKDQIRKISSRALIRSIYVMLVVVLYVTLVVNKYPCYTKISGAVVLMGVVMMVLLNCEEFSSMKMVGQQMAARNNERSEAVISSFWDYIRSDLVMPMMFAALGMFFLCFLFVYTVTCCATAMSLPPAPI